MAEAKRKLAAILSADVVGYSRLMGDDERATLDTLNVYRGVFKARIHTHDGRLVDTAGDSVLAVFDSVVEAVQCAVEIQSELRTQNCDLPENRRMAFRIGVNLGDVIVQDDGTIYGDGVNVAARLESLAEPGGLCISESAHMQVRTKLDFGFEDLGEHEVKNIAEPIRAYRVPTDGSSATVTRAPSFVPGRRTGLIGAVAVVALTVAGVALWWGTKVPPATMMPRVAQNGLVFPEGPSIAVLPFENLSGDPGQNYFSDGFTEDLITWLGHFPELVVISRGAVMQYKGTAVDPARVRQDLGVSYVLEGSVRRPTNRLLVTVQLTDAETGVLLWSERHDEVIDDLFDVQDRIARRVASTLSDELGQIARALALAKPTDSLVAYDHMLRGWHHLGQHSRQGNQDARSEFKDALNIDPKLARAYIGLGFTYYLPIISGWTEFADKSLIQAEALVDEALSVDPSIARAYQLRGFIHILRGQYEKARRALDMALQVNPSDARSYVSRGVVELFAGSPERAVEFMESGHGLNPRLGEVAFVNLGLAYAAAGRYDDAVRTLEEAGDRKGIFESEHPVPYFRHLGLAIAHAQLDHLNDARNAAAEVRRLWPFFNADQFVGQFRAPETRMRFSEALAVAGLNSDQRPSPESP